ncbi:MAG TPA: hypothetical protein VE781_02540 [Kineosporiaceae bacterium]|nr:hypothetical protein [Kineosporiaceae bacterium]
MTAPVVRPEVARFVDDVRAALADLAPEEVDDLTEGLAADVSDTVGDGDVASLGDPTAYAAELRSAAGLPPRGGGGAGSGVAAIFAADRRMLDAGQAWLDRQAWWPKVRDFLVVIRPCWWVLRGWAVFQVVASGLGIDRSILPHGLFGLVLFAALVVASVQVGLRSAGYTGTRYALLLTVNVVVVAVLLAELATPWSSMQAAAQEYATAAPSGEGLWANGEPVRNVFAYDAEGRLVPVVQLYDQDGRPLELAPDARTQSADDGTGLEAVPAVNADGRVLWNAYPVRQVPAGQGVDESGRPIPAAPAPAPTSAPPPFRGVAPVVTPSASPSPSPSVSPGASPGVLASPSSSASPSPTASPRR